MGKILPGIFVAFENPKGGVGKSTLTALFAGYIHATAKETGLTVGVVDIDDAQNTIGKMRLFEATQQESLDEEYQVMNISSSEFIENMDFLKENFDIILVDFPGNLKQAGVVETLMMIDVLIIPFEPSKIEIMHTINFFDYYKANIMAKREELGYKTTVRGLPNRVVPNLIEYKDLVTNQNEFPIKLMQQHIKESRVQFQRNLSTLISNYNHVCDEFGDEMVQLITEHIKA
jgi:cellulose biosynthesis protein BcsQ